MPRQSPDISASRSKLVGRLRPYGARPTNLAVLPSSIELRVAGVAIGEDTKLVYVTREMIKAGFNAVKTAADLTDPVNLR